MKMITFKEYLEENISINKDVDLIYRSVFKSFIDNLNKGIITELPMVTFKSDQLQSTDAKMANKINPIIIHAGVSEEGSYYQPLSNRMVISFNYNVFKLFKIYKSVEHTMSMVSPSQIKRFMEEVKGNAVKYTIFHELSHWIDDSLHNRHLTNTIKRASELRGTKRDRTLTRGGESTTSTDYEINAQIHSIKRAKLQNKKIWNNISFDKILDLIPALNSVYVHMETANREKWLKKLKQRMAREGLLGKNMR